MTTVRVFTKTTCPHSIAAKDLLRRKGVPFEEIDIAKEPGRRDEMIRAAGGATTVPQVFIDGRHAGGESDLVELDERGELDALLGRPQPTA